MQESATPKDYCQAHPDNLVGHLIALERCTTPAELREHIQLLQHKVNSATYQPIRRAFAIWLSRLLRVKFKQETIPEYQELIEVNAMLAERINDWTLEWKKEGEKLGLELGEKRGLEIGAKVGAEEEARRLVSRLIRLKYGDFPAWAVLKLDQADTAQLEYWAEHILTAESIEALFV